MNRALAFLHTASAHEPTFTALLRERGPGMRAHHVVRTDLLATMRDRGEDALRPVLAEALSRIGAEVICCTCSSIGGLAEDLDARVFRLDRPMMEDAVRHGPDILVAVCLESTIEPSIGLLRDCAARVDAIVSPRLARVTEAWPLFEAGRTDDFAQAVAEGVMRALADGPTPDAVVLAQASMRGAARHLTDCPAPILTSPERAVAEALRRVAARA